MLWGMPLRAAAALWFVVAVAGRAAARPADAPVSKEADASDRLYQKGLDQYSRGDRAGALETFRAVERSDPADRFARAAVRRLESELAPRPPAVRPASYAEDLSRLDRFLLVELPRWYHFDRSVGNSLSAVGTLAALNARVRQLMGERKVALAKMRRFRKERELRELLRRAPLAALGLDEA